MKRKLFLVIIISFEVLCLLAGCDTINQLANSMKKTRYNKNNMVRNLSLIAALNNSNKVIGDLEFKSVAVDSNGNAYTSGNIRGSGTCNFGNNIIATGIYEYDNSVLVKYNSFGQAQWAQTVTSAS